MARRATSVPKPLMVLLLLHLLVQPLWAEADILQVRVAPSQNQAPITASLERPTRISLEKLAPRSCYELRLSYLGFTPLNVRFTWDCEDAQARRLGRELLDSEKLMFCTGPEGRPLASCEHILLDLTYVGWPASGTPPRSVLIDLILEPTYLFLTGTTWMVIGILLCGLALVWGCLVPCLLSQRWPLWRFKAT